MYFTNKKLRETGFFLARLFEFSSNVLDKEEFHFYLSAFLSAGRSVTFALQKEHHNDDYGKAYNLWKENLADEDKIILDFMKNQRNQNEKEGSPTLDINKYFIKLANYFEDKSGKIMLFGPPEIYFEDSTSSTSKTDYYFEFNGKKELVTKLCSRYYNLLTDLIQGISKTV